MGKDQKPYYLIEGKVYPRVTRILSVIKDIEYEGNPDPAILEEAASVGTKVHKIIDNNIKELKQPLIADPRVHSCWKAYQDWKITRRPENPRSEVLVWSTQHQVASTLDLIDNEYITDFKTSFKLLLRNWLQVNAGNRIFQEWSFNQGFGQPPYEHKCRLVRLDKTLAMYQEEIRPYSDALWQTFLKIKEVYIDMLGAELLDGELELLGREHGDDSDK